MNSNRDRQTRRLVQKPGVRGQLFVMTDDGEPLALGAFSSAPESSFPETRSEIKKLTMDKEVSSHGDGGGRVSLGWSVWEVGRGGMRVRLRMPTRNTLITCIWMQAKVVTIARKFPPSVGFCITILLRPSSGEKGSARLGEEEKRTSRAESEVNWYFSTCPLLICGPVGGPGRVLTSSTG